MQRSASYTQADDSCWTGLYRTAGVAAVITALAIDLAWSRSGLAAADQGAVADWFTRFQTSWLRGTLDLDLLMLISNVAVIPDLDRRLCRASPRKPILDGAGGAARPITATTDLSSSRLFEMAALSSQYASATTEAQRVTPAPPGTPC